MSRDDDELLKAERARMAAAFDGVLGEPVPERLRALLAEPKVVSLDAARTARRPGMNRWAAWGGMAATLVLGTLIGTRLAPVGVEDRLIANGAIAEALTTQLASAPAGPVAVQISFKSRDGRWCRSFTTGTQAGLACRDTDGAWVLQQLAAAQAGSGVMRQAASSLPPSVLAAVDATIAGEALSADQEKTARDAGWK